MAKRWISVPSRTKEILETYDLRAKKGFGQNFLVDPVIVQRCADEAHCEGLVIEIGPGIGSLTEQLAERAQKVIAYEVDEDLIPVLQDTLKDYDNVEVILQDFLEADLKTLVPEWQKQYGMVTVCANLPYYITTPVLFKIFEEAPQIPYITVMVQKEVGERFAAEPGSAQYSALSVEGQYLYKVRKLFTVPGRSFNPSPNVDSVIIQFAARGVSHEDIDTEEFFALVRACFKQRRKTVYNNLREYTGNAAEAEEILNRAGIPASLRAQQLTVEQMIRIYEAVR